MDANGWMPATLPAEPYVRVPDGDGIDVTPENAPDAVQVESAREAIRRIREGETLPKAFPALTENRAFAIAGALAAVGIYMGWMA